MGEYSYHEMLRKLELEHAVRQMAEMMAIYHKSLVSMGIPNELANLMVLEFQATTLKGI